MNKQMNKTYSDEELEKIKEALSKYDKKHEDKTITFTDELLKPLHNFRYEDNNPDDNPVDHPSHYQSMSGKVNVECIDAMRAAFGDYEVAVWCRINAFKYLWRSDSKGGNTDIEKAQWYLNKFMELGGCDQ